MLLALLAYGLGRKLPEITRIALWCTAAEELVEVLPIGHPEIRP